MRLRHLAIASAGAIALGYGAVATRYSVERCESVYCVVFDRWTGRLERRGIVDAPRPAPITQPDSTNRWLRYSDTTNPWREAFPEAP